VRDVLGRGPVTAGTAHLLSLLESVPTGVAS
jgi:hypothetical protein